MGSLYSAFTKDIIRTMVETGSTLLWDAAVVLEGDGNKGSVWEFYLDALSSNYQQTDIRTKMIHQGKKTGGSSPLEKGITAQCGHARSSRGLRVLKSLLNLTQCWQ